MTVTTTGEDKSDVPARTRTRTPTAGSGGGSRDPHHHRHAADQAIRDNSTHLDVDLGPAHLHVTLPPLDRLAFYAGLTGAAAFGVVEWPIAVITGVGHALSANRHNRTLRALGEAMDAV